MQVPVKESTFRTNLNGVFKFKIGGITGPVYFSLGIKGNTVRSKSAIDYPILNLYLAMPGDSITMINVGSPKISFFGSGAAKYRCRNEIDAKTLFLSDLYDSIGQTEILDQNKAQLETEIYKIMKADIVGKQYSRQYLFFISKDKAKYDLLNAQHKTLNFPPEVLASSRLYTSLLLEKARVDSRFAGISAYSLIKKSYPGELRDKLIADYFIDYADRDSTLTSDIADACTSVKTPYCLDQIQQIAEHQKVGFPAYSFSLKNAGDQDVHLSDFKGKIVFIDFWYTGCLNCSMYYKSKVSKAEAFFKDNPDVVFITICIDREQERWKKSIESGAYTSNDAINLYTNGEADNHPVIKYYNVEGYPHPLLIDKQGKLFTNYDHDLSHGTIDEKNLIATIKKALDKK